MTESIEKEQGRRATRPTIAVSRVLPHGALVELVQDSDRTRFAHGQGNQVELVDHVDLPDGRRLVPVSARNNLIRHGVVLLPEKVDHFDSITSLRASIEAYITKYVDLSPDFLRIAVAYVLLSWVYDCMNELPYLRFRGDYGSGKTRALLVIGSLLWKPLFASGASTISPIFHALDLFRGSLVVDESDFRMSDEKADLVKIFNNGNVRGFPVLRSQGNKEGVYDPRAFHVFGPKMIAMRHSFEDKALESRFLTEEMGMRPLRNGIPLNLPDCQVHEARALRNNLLAYRFQMHGKVAIDPSCYSSTLSPRTNQIIAPLLAVIDDQALRRSIQDRMRESERETRAERSSTPEGQVLDVIFSLLGDEEFIPIGEITEVMIERFGKEYDRPLTARYVGHLIRTRLRLHTWKRHGNFVLGTKEREQLTLLAERYGCRVPNLRDDTIP
jgi:hypothetical protein